MGDLEGIFMNINEPDPQLVKTDTAKSKINAATLIYTRWAFVPNASSGAAQTWKNPDPDTSRSAQPRCKHAPSVPRSEAKGRGGLPLLRNPALTFWWHIAFARSFQPILESVRR